MTENAHTKFIRAGLKLYPELGFRKLSVRALAAEAGLSPGMFHHLFANKDAFVAEVLAQKREFILGKATEAGLPQAPLAKLREVMRRLSCACRDDLMTAHRLLTDSADGVEVVNEAIRESMEKQFALLSALLDECEQAYGGAHIPPVQRLIYLSGAVNIAMVEGVRFKHAGLLLPPLAETFDEALTDEAILQRIDWSIGAMFPDYRPAE